MKIDFLIAKGINIHVANDVVEDFFLDIPEDDYNVIINHKSLYSSSLSFLFRYKPLKTLINSVVKKRRTENSSCNSFSILMNQDDRNILPHYFLTNNEKYLYFFDAWPRNYNNILKIVDDYAIKKAFLSSGSSCNTLNKMQDKCEFVWIPEGINTNRYTALNLQDKDIDLICIGRKYEKLHDKIVAETLAEEISYIYQSGSEVIYPAREDFVDALSRSKISICIPANLTHPEKTGGIETITNRYFQSMASKCIILGHAPKELIDIFGYNPVIEIDYSNPLAQIKEILSNLDDYEKLTERNFDEIHTNHKWSNRWANIEAEINACSSKPV